MGWVRICQFVRPKLLCDIFSRGWGDPFSRDPQYDRISSLFSRDPQADRISSPFFSRSAIWSSFIPHFPPSATPRTPKSGRVVPAAVHGVRHRLPHPRCRDPPGTDRLAWSLPLKGRVQTRRCPVTDFSVRDHSQKRRKINPLNLSSIVWVLKT